MKLRVQIWLIPLLLLLLNGIAIEKVQAAKGEPGTSGFGFGAVIYPQDPDIQQAMALAVDLELDWIRVPVAWKDYQAYQDGPVRLEPLDLIMQTAGQNDLAVLVSISDPPDWALTGSGPDADQAARFVQAVVRRFPKTLRAVELFPGANTRQAWGAEPDPQAYLHLFQKVDQLLHDEPEPVLLVAAGLRPLPFLHPTGDMDDLAYLQKLYRLGADQSMPVISLQYFQPAEDPLLPPTGREKQALRHYENVRQVMIKNDHQSGMIWITHLSLPSGTIRVAGSVTTYQEAQSAWLSQAYVQLRSQLYIGAAFLPSLNSTGEETAEEVLSLLRETGEIHPFYPIMRQMIRLNQAGSLAAVPGRAKEGSFEKMRP